MHAGRARDACRQQAPKAAGSANDGRMEFESRERATKNTITWGGASHDSNVRVMGDQRPLTGPSGLLVGSLHESFGHER